MQTQAPDLLDLGSHFEHRPTLTEAFEPDKPEFETADHREDSRARHRSVPKSLQDFLDRGNGAQRSGFHT
jgi:hypothetical protein